MGIIRKGPFTLDGYEASNVVIEFGRGWIRFVGGPWHNEFRRLRWVDWFRVPIPARPGMLKNPPADLSGVLLIAEYRLVECSLPTGCVFYEYHFQG